MPKPNFMSRRTHLCKGCRADTQSLTTQWCDTCRPTGRPRRSPRLCEGHCGTVAPGKAKWCDACRPLAIRLQRQQRHLRRKHSEYVPYKGDLSPGMIDKLFNAAKAKQQRARWRAS